MENDYKFIVGIFKEQFPEEKRVPITPNDVKKFIKEGNKVYVEKGAGDKCGFSDEQYEKAGAKITHKQGVIKQANFFPKVKQLIGTELSEGDDSKNEIKQFFDVVGEEAETITKFVLSFISPDHVSKEDNELYAKMSGKLERMDSEKTNKTILDSMSYISGEQMVELGFKKYRETHNNQTPEVVNIAGAGSIAVGALKGLDKYLSPNRNINPFRVVYCRNKEKAIQRFESEGIKMENILFKPMNELKKNIEQKDFLLMAMMDKVQNPNDEHLLYSEHIKSMQENSIIMEIDPGELSWIDCYFPDTTHKNPFKSIQNQEGKEIHVCTIPNYPSAVPHEASIAISKELTNTVIQLQKLNPEELKKHFVPNKLADLF